MLKQEAQPKSLFQPQQNLAQHLFQTTWNQLPVQEHISLPFRNDICPKTKGSALLSDVRPVFPATRQQLPSIQAQGDEQAGRVALALAGRYENEASAIRCGITAGREVWENSGHPQQRIAWYSLVGHTRKYPRCCGLLQNVLHYGDCCGERKEQSLLVYKPTMLHAKHHCWQARASRLDQKRTLDGAGIATSPSTLQRKLLNINLYPEVWIPTPSNILNFKGLFFYFGWVFALISAAPTVHIHYLITGIVSDVEFWPSVTSCGKKLSKLPWGKHSLIPLECSIKAA